ncbi:acyltransferase [Mesorhizobium sp. M4B.F.Ca.ET.089.01.1.1]|nr:acyltransferase [Mesorhizobium sp. M4B.F.Ca.ET.089.01.1.1]
MGVYLCACSFPGVTRLESGHGVATRRSNTCRCIKHVTWTDPMRAVFAFVTLGLAALAASMLFMLLLRAYPALHGDRGRLPGSPLTGTASNRVAGVSSRIGEEYELTTRQISASREKLFWNNIQILRLTAAYGIVYVHLEPVFIAIGAGSTIVDMLRFGTDLFLVVSGFLSAHVLSRPGRTAPAYLRDRAIRILPLYWLFTLAAFFAKDWVTGYGTPTVRELVMSMLFIPYGPYPILHPTWTLVIIVQFSLIMAACLAVSRRNAAYLASAFVVLLVLLGRIFRPQNPALAAYTDPILIDFAFGVLIYKALGGEQRWPAQDRAVGWALLALGIGMAAVVLRPMFWADLPRLVGLGLPAALLLFGTVILERSGHVVRSAAVNFVARCTFAIYLCHQFVNGASEKIVSLDPTSRIVHVLVLVATPLLVTIVAVFIFSYVEAPVTRHLKGHLG